MSKRRRPRCRCLEEDYRHAPRFSIVPMGALVRGQVSDWAWSSCERGFDSLDRHFECAGRRAGRSAASGQSLQPTYSLPQAPASGPDCRRRTINLVCLGHGSPTVVLTAGLGGWSWVWYRIQKPLSRRTRVCAWDPAGLGFSSPSPEPQDAIHETEDLEQALKGAHIDGPYKVVAHSAGAYVAIRFADQYPGTVVGEVLVDPAIPDQEAVRKRVAPKFAASAAGRRGRKPWHCASAPPSFEAAL